MNDYKLLAASLAVLVIAGLAAGCDNFGAPEANSVGSESAAARAVEAATQFTKAEILANLGTSTFDGYMAAINDDVPDFAGAYFEEDGTLKIAMVGGQSKADQIPAVIAALDDGAPDFSRTVGAAQVEIIPAQYDFASLVAWKEMSNPFMDLGVKFIDADERENKIVLAITDPSLESRVRDAASKIGIPDDAFVVEVVPEMVSMDFDLERETDYLEGGYQIAIGYANGQDITCTLGFLAYRGSFSGAIGGFLTNSHCTGVKGAVDGQRFNQDSWQDGSEIIGYEIADPAWTSSGAGTISRASEDGGYGMFGPPVGGRPYRFSDAAFADYTGNRTTLFGQLAKTRYRNQFSPGHKGRIKSFEIIGNDTNNSQLLVGVEVNKVGAKSGWTYGTISRGCVNMADFDDPSRDLKCQYHVNGYADRGDSGSPVFRIVPGTDDVTLSGMLFGGTIQGGNPVPPWFFSPFQGINSDLRYPGAGAQANLVTY